VSSSGELDHDSKTVVMQSFVAELVVYANDKKHKKEVESILDDLPQVQPLVRVSSINPDEIESPLIQLQKERSKHFEDANPLISPMEEHSD
jgi:tRNA A37 methylthiotransferase MiaB